jgi:hypothetical protein
MNFSNLLSKRPSIEVFKNLHLSNPVAPEVDPFSHFILSVEDSYKEQGGSETVVKVLKDVEEITKKQIHKIEEVNISTPVSEFIRISPSKV